MKALLFFAVLLSVFAEATYAQTKITGSGQTSTETRSIGRFKSVRISGAFKAILVKGETSALRLEADDNVLPRIETFVEGGILVIKPKNNSWFQNTGPMTAYITFTELEGLDVSGAVSASCESAIETPRFAIDASGASNLRLTLKVNELDGDVSGASKINLSGSADRFGLDASGATSLYAFDMRTLRTRLSLSGASKVEISVSESLDVDASGASKVTFRGNPRSQHIDASGASKVRKEAD
jgi:Putative auto-transporter adhesin, head GIN domain